MQLLEKNKQIAASIYLSSVESFRVYGELRIVISIL